MNQIPLILISVTSALIGYGFYAFNSNDSFRILIAIVAFVYSLITLFTTFVQKYETSRIKTVIGFTGTTFFAIGIVILVLVMLLTNSMVWIILPIGLILMLYLGVIYFISKSGQ